MIRISVKKIQTDLAWALMVFKRKKVIGVEMDKHPLSLICVCLQFQRKEGGTIFF